MLTTLWTRSVLAARLAADTQLGRATHLPAAERARLHLELLNASSDVDAGRLDEPEALAAFDSLRDRLVEQNEAVTAG
ncbi:hypothetical protein AX769_11205 [Frondihabitans sp. PAMC 28766]|nr:hypothetical protein AX769_11205 [Frondihabitans sp. PAMC 28766]